MYEREIAVKNTVLRTLEAFGKWEPCLAQMHMHKGGVCSDVDEVRTKKSAPSYKVTFFVPGGKTIPPAIVLAGCKLPRPQDPVLKGHRFTGWYHVCENGEACRWDFASDTVSANIILYAVWSPAFKFGPMRQRSLQLLAQ